MVMCGTSCAPRQLPTGPAGHNVEITKEYILSEIAELESELKKAKTFTIQAQAAIDTHKTILNRLETPDGDLPETP